MSENEEDDTTANFLSEDCDWYLQELIRLANKGLEVPVTLSCGGNAGAGCRQIQ